MTSNIQVITDDTWDEWVLKATKPVFIMHYSPDCPHCKNLTPYFEKYATEFQGKVVFGRINIAENLQVASTYHIMGTPTFTFFCHGKLMSQQVGELYPALIKKMIEDGIQYGKDCLEKTTWVDYGMDGYV